MQRAGSPPDESAPTPTPGAPGQTQALLSKVDGLIRDAHVRERFGVLGPAFSIALGSWIEPFATAMQGLEPTAHLQAAARAMAEIAHLTGTFARDAARPLAGVQTGRMDSGSCEHHAELVARIDDSFRIFSSSPEFDRARRRAAAAILDWLEHDRDAASSVGRALESPPAHAWRQCDDSTPADTATVMRDGNATLVRYPIERAVRASVLVIPGFTTGALIFDLGPQRSVTRTLAEHGVETWLLDWDRSDETDRLRTVANQLDRIDRALDTVRAAANGRRPALAGHFHGGLLALLYCIRYPGKAGALVTLSTPVEFGSRHDVFGDWLRACDGERLVEIFGNIPGALIAALLATASPMRWCGGGFFTLLDGADSVAAAARIERFEHARRFPPAFPGETFRGLYRSFYRDNSFATGGGAVIDGRRYDPSNLATPVLNVFARNDRIVPPGASTPLAELAADAPCSSREHRGGHFDLLAGHGAHTGLLPDIAAWLVEEHARGS